MMVFGVCGHCQDTRAGTQEPAGLPEPPHRLQWQVSKDAWQDVHHLVVQHCVEEWLSRSSDLSQMVDRPSCLARHLQWIWAALEPDADIIAMSKPRWL